MSEERAKSESLAELRRRWDSEPSARLALHLAEEYRQADETEEAVRILEQALQDHPRHVAARVLLGRYRFELGDLQGARELLEGVVTEDPTHLVATKLLVGLYLDQGHDKLAQDRLDLYKVLNEGDPEIENLEARLRGEEPAGQAGARSNGGGLVRPDPFPGLRVGIGDARYWQIFAAGGIFPVPPELLIEPLPVDVEAVEPQPRAGATVTLANLYLQQGYVEDAEREFRAVLEAEPGNAQAEAGLFEIERRSASAESVEEADSGPTLEARKVAALKRYLQQIRRAAE